MYAQESLPDLRHSAFARRTRRHTQGFRLMRYATRILCLLLLAASLTALGQAQQMEVLHLGADSDAGPKLDPRDLVLVNHCDSGWCCEYPGWYASGDALFLKRNEARNNVLVVADRGTLLDPTDDTVLLTTRDLNFTDFETGFRATLGRSLGHGLALEGSYFQVEEWDAFAQVTSNGLIVSSALGEGLSPPLPFNFPFFNADTFYEAVQQTVVYRSELKNAELNLKATCKHHNIIHTEFVGIRYLKVRENFVLTSQDEVTSTPTAGLGTYTIDTDNDLLGGQYGQEYGIPLFGMVLLSTKLKAGLFGNSVEQTTEIIDSGVIRYNARDTEPELSFVGEINFSADVRVNNFISVHGGYNLLWVQQVALAPEQNYPLGLAAVSPINDNGHLFYHGFNLGVQISR